MKAEQGFCAALQGAFVGRPANLDVGNVAGVIAMGEPGAPIRSLAQNIGGARRREDAEGKLAVLGEISPGVDLGVHFGCVAQRSAGGLSGRLFFRRRRVSGKAGASPMNSRKTLRTWPKLRLGSKCWTRSKTSPLASLCGSHQPRPSWLRMRISPLPRRYLRQCLVLSLRSIVQGGD